MLPRRTFCALLPALAAPAPDNAPLEIAVTASGRPAAARIYISGEDHRAHLVPGAVTFARRGESHSLIDGRATLSLPPGRYTVRAEKGAEYRPAETTVTIPAASPRVSLDLAPFCDMNARGWYSGDLHIHRKPEEMPLAARAEHLNVLPVITRHVGGERPDNPPFPASNVAPVDAAHFVTLQNQEVERLRTGHGAVLLLNTPRPVAENVPLLWPPDLDFCRAARAQGGFVDVEKPIWKNVPVNAAFGVIDSVGVVNNHFHPHEIMLDAETYGAMDRGDPRYRTGHGFAEWMMDLYYRLLNCGFRLPVSAGSASGIMPSWPGYERVYVHLSGPFTVDRWFRDLKAGRSFGTNGPLMLVTCDKQPPGAVIPWRKSMRVELQIEVRSQGNIERVEVIHNGKPVVTSTQTQVSKRLTVDAPGWLAVRCFEQSEPVRYAHTSPYYFPTGGRQPVIREAAAQWAQVIRKIAAEPKPRDYPSPEDYEKAQAILHQAAEIYARL